MGKGMTLRHRFEVRELSLAQIRSVYSERMTRDFPPDELKPLQAIERALERGVYACYGAMDGTEVLAYAFFVNLSEPGGRYALLDYYAVRQELRGQGVGSRFIQALMAGPLREMDCVLLEVDDPACAETAEDLSARTRRMDFYLRNGLRDTSVTAEVYRVKYRILTLPLGSMSSVEETRRIYAALYRAILPEGVYESMVRIY